MKNQKMYSLVLLSMKLFAGISSDDPKVIVEEFYRSNRILTKNALMMFPALYLIWMDNYQKKSDYILELFPFSIRHEKHSEDEKFPAVPVLISLTFEKFLEESIGLIENNNQVSRFEIPNGFELDNSLDLVVKRMDRGIQTPPLKDETSINMVYWNYLVYNRHVGIYAYLFELGDQMFRDIEVELAFYCSIFGGTQMYHKEFASHEVWRDLKKKLSELVELRDTDPAVAQILGYFSNGYEIQSSSKESKVE